LKGRSYPSFNILTVQGKRVLVERVNVINGTTEEILQTDV